MAETVWLVESGEYEQRGVDLVGATKASAAAALRRSYGPPYRVEWVDHLDDPERPHMIGRFEDVAGFSTEHVSWFYFSERPVKDGEEEAANG